MDIFYTSSSEPEADPTDSAAGEPAPVAGTPASGHRLCVALDDAVRHDAATWRRFLQQAGFTPAEANRLIFERVRPRGEGLVRTSTP
jgi:hypothetical protein